MIPYPRAFPRLAASLSAILLLAAQSGPAQVFVAADPSTSSPDAPRIVGEISSGTPIFATAEANDMARKSGIILVWGTAADGAETTGLLLPVEIVPDDDQPGNTGDQIPSNKGQTGEKHFVSPKKSDDFVVLNTKGIEKELFEQVLEWEGGEAVPNEPLKRRVQRAATGKTAIKLKTKEGGQEVDLMNGWVIWATMTGRKEDGAALSPNNDVTLEYLRLSHLGRGENDHEFPFGDQLWQQHSFNTAIKWKAAIESAAMFDLDSDVPALHPMAPKDSEGFYDEGRAYYTHWDIPRDRKRTRTDNGQVTENEVEWTHDDDVNGPRDEDPYEQSSEREESAELFSVDGPGFEYTIKTEDGVVVEHVPPMNIVSWQLDQVFQEWVRVRLGGKWYDVADKADWWATIKLVRTVGQWGVEEWNVDVGIRPPE